MNEEKSLVSFKIYCIMCLPNLQDVRIPFQKFIWKFVKRINISAQTQTRSTSSFWICASWNYWQAFRNQKPFVLQPLAQFSFLNFDTRGNQSICQSQTRFENWHSSRRPWLSNSILDGSFILLNKQMLDSYSLI